MAKKGIVNNNRRKKLLRDKYQTKVQELKLCRKKTSAENFQLMLEREKLPRNAAACRVRYRCELTGRGRGWYKKFSISRIALRDLAVRGLIPGVKKSSW